MSPIKLAEPVQDLPRRTANCEETSWQAACDEFLRWLSSIESWKERRKRDAAAAALRSSIRRRRCYGLAVSIAALLMLVASFRAGQELPQERCRELRGHIASGAVDSSNAGAEWDITQNSLATVPTLPGDESRLRPLAQKWCTGCGQWIWPLSRSVVCPDCEPQHSAGQQENGAGN